MPTKSLLLAFALAGCAAPLERHEFREPHMGTEFRLVLYAPSAARANAAAQAAFARIAELDGELSDYDPESELSRLGAASDAGAPTGAIELSGDLARVLARSLAIARASNGAFDPTVGPLTQLWRRARRQGELPDDARLRAALASVGWKSCELDEQTGTARLLAVGMRFDLGGIAKGFALDEALKELERCGIERALVVGGGEMRAGRAPPDRTGWRIELTPFANETEVGAIELADAAVATSGDAEQALELDGVRYSHILDPRTGRALTRRTAASVIARDATTADALATALCVLGPSDGLALIETMPGTHARISVIDGARAETVQSPAFAHFMLSPSSAAPRPISSARP
jgi:thiamine biosynthesis lipoprotein